MVDKALTKEELAADLVWRYVERLREAEDPSVVALDSAELAQLVAALEAAGSVPGAIMVEEPEARRTEVRQRLEPSLAHGRAAAPVSRPRDRATVVPAWQFRLAMAASLVGALLLTTVNGWHRIPAAVQRVPVWRDAQGLEPMDEQQAHQLIPVMLRNELSSATERSLMGHMLVCTGCFEDYRAAKGSPVAHSAPAPMTLASHR